MLVKLKLPGILEDMRVSEIVVEVPLTFRGFLYVSHLLSCCELDFLW